MKNGRWMLVLLFVAALSFPAIAGDGHKCSYDTQTCLNQMAAKLKTRGWVGIEMDVDEETGKLTINRIVPESPAMEAGLQVGDVLHAMDGITFNEENKDKMYEARKEMTPGKTITYTVDRPGCCHIKGGKTDIAITLGELPDTVLAQWIGSHMMEHAVIEIAQQ